MKYFLWELFSNVKRSTSVASCSPPMEEGRFKGGAGDVLGVTEAAAARNQVQIYSCEFPKFF